MCLVVVVGVRVTIKVLGQVVLDRTGAHSLGLEQETQEMLSVVIVGMARR